MKKLILLILLSVVVVCGYDRWDKLKETYGMTDSEVAEWAKQKIQGIIKKCLNGDVKSCEIYANEVGNNIENYFRRILTIDDTKFDNTISNVEEIKKEYKTFRIIEISSFLIGYDGLNCKSYMKILRKGCNLNSGRCCALLGDEFNPILFPDSSGPKYGKSCSLFNQNEAFKYYKKACDLGERLGCRQYNQLQKGGYKSLR